MKVFNKSVIPVFVLGVVAGSAMNITDAAAAWDDASITNIVNDHQDQITQNNADSIARDLSTDNRLTQVDSDLQSTKLGVLIVDQATKEANQKALLAGALADTANQKSEAALQGVMKNGTEIINMENVNKVQDNRLDNLESAPKPTNGVNGVDGKDGVTTTVTRVQVDAATQTKVANNSQAVTATAQELQATKQTLQAMNNNTSQQFKSLHDEVDNNKKQANAGISGAMAMAGLPQVQTNQHVMFSAGGATYNSESALAVGASVNVNPHTIAKVSFSDDTANNMGASIGVGVGF
ncbi:YadA C-terminal domain-containing protein [Enterobacter asburiae]|jgi:autotransporter adhesin|uniref:YadA C-terminal domain-containing protein n=1 Tax=Enterobacter asburiae TaxID=61645 RepID=UPI00288B58DC|nr:YadA C-terminal domain-containing protein [Enterobacter asburiae]WNI62871.1 YadA C-terminal domain-containing protein [Enterobacter asburiae]WNI68897.1 YadA C-terminal domain-containing protein [Enterobacter asburiae]